MIDKQRVIELVEERFDRYRRLADEVWEHAELNYLEFKSCQAHARVLEEEGFRITRDVGGIATAVMGEAGEGGPVIAVLGEYDALPGLSQQAGEVERRPLVTDGAGHGCGHNLLGAGSLMAAAAVKDYLKENNLPGRVRYYGCPAEEGGAAKGFMVRDGVFGDVTAAVSWHPATFAQVNTLPSLANQRIDFHFVGRAAHASASPHLGRSALDAVEVMNVGTNYLREHMPPDARVHYSIIDAGGNAPNVVQERATVRYLIRSAELPELYELVDRVRNIAKGAALITGTTVSESVRSGMSNLLVNHALDEAMYDNLLEIGPPPFTDEDEEFARQVQSVLTEADISASFARVQLPKDGSSALCRTIVPLENRPAPVTGGGSTDVGDVSWAVPTVQARGATWAIGTPAHSWIAVAQGKSGYAYRGMLHAATLMAMTATDMFVDPDLLARAVAEHERHLEQTPYVCPIPANVPVPTDLSVEPGP